MRDPLSFTIPLFPIFGLRFRMHILFLVVMLGLAFRQLLGRDKVVWTADLVISENPVPATEVLGLVAGLLFVIVLLHELGHALVVRWLGGESRERILWPLGGLGQDDLPAEPSSHMIAGAAGPLTNLLICLSMGTLLALNGFVPSFNPFGNPYIAEIHNYRDGRSYTSVHGANLYDIGSTKKKEEIPPELRKKFGKTEEFRTEAQKARLEWAVAPTGMVWAQRAFWVSWIMLLLNLLPAYPLDGGAMLQAFIWSRTDHRQGILTTSYVGFLVCLLLLLLTIATGEILLMLLVMMIYLTSAMRFHSDEVERDPLGYDFTQGYTSLEQEPDTIQKRPKSPGFLARWKQSRNEKRQLREQAQKQEDERRMDQLLEKISRKEPLTEDEKQFMNRVSQRYRNKS